MDLCTVNPKSQKHIKRTTALNDWLLRQHSYFIYKTIYIYIYMVLYIYYIYMYVYIHIYSTLKLYFLLMYINTYGILSLMYW